VRLAKIPDCARGSEARRAAAIPPHARICDDRAVAAGSDSYQRIYAVVRRIPRGRITTYGQVAQQAGLGGRARQVGYALHALAAGDRLPWHRVLNAQGRVSPRAEPGGDRVQRALLEREGIRFDAAGRADLARFGWRPRAVVTRAKSTSKRARR
jgi:methylated-DNA-protein-cysteine methyltransferase-like protein